MDFNNKLKIYLNFNKIIKIKKKLEFLNRKINYLKLNKRDDFE